MIDYHCHLLPSIDDGPSTMEETIHMAYLLMKAGYHTIYCTPHMIKYLYDADNSTIKNLINDVQKLLAKKDISIKLLCGREYIIDNHFHEYLNDLQPLENTKYLLVEFQPVTYPGLIKDSITAILKKGLIPMIAHPERCRLFHEKNSDPEPFKNNSSLKYWFSARKSRINSLPAEIHDDKELLNWLIANNCAFQNNLLSYKGVYGNQTKTTAFYFQKAGIFTHEGTDAHSPYCIEKIFNLNFSDFDIIYTDTKDNNQLH